MILSTHVTSSKEGGKKSLEGLNLSLSERLITAHHFAKAPRGFLRTKKIAERKQANLWLVLLWKCLVLDKDFVVIS